MTPHKAALLEDIGPMPEGLPLLIDRAYQDNQTGALARSLGMIPVVPSKRNRRDPWPYDRALYRIPEAQ